jgi:hypothetical protein
MEPGAHIALTEVMVGAGVTARATTLDLVGSSVEVAMMVALPGARAVNTPLAVIVPTPAGLTDQLTVLA